MTPGRDAEPEHSEEFADLADAISAYLLEIDGYCDVCRRCEKAVVVHKRSAGIEVARFFEFRDATLSHLRSALGVLGGNDEIALARKHLSAPLLRYSLSWKHRRLLVAASLFQADMALLQVTLFLPHLVSDLPELPLRTLAHALLCHEFLLPEPIAFPRPPPRLPQALSVFDYLQRAMPEKLYASQCIRAIGAV
jgi:hypothetical protein